MATLYVTLGVPKHPTDAEIKRDYRKARACKSWGGSEGGPLVHPFAATVPSGVG